MLRGIQLRMLYTEYSLVSVQMCANDNMLQ